MFKNECMSYGSDKDGGFNSTCKAYKADPTITNYLKLRRSDPEAEIEVATLGGFDSVLAMRSEFEAYGFTIEEILGLLDAEQGTITDISLRLLEELVHQEELLKNGESQIVRRDKAMPP